MTSTLSSPGWYKYRTFADDGSNSFLSPTTCFNDGRKGFCATVLILIASEGIFPIKKVVLLLSVRMTSGKARTHSVLGFGDPPEKANKNSCTY